MVAKKPARKPRKGGQKADPQLELLPEDGDRRMLLAIADVASRECALVFDNVLNRVVELNQRLVELHFRLRSLLPKRHRVVVSYLYANPAEGRGRSNPQVMWVRWFDPSRKFGSSGRREGWTESWKGQRVPKEKVLFSMPRAGPFAETFYEAKSIVKRMLAIEEERSSLLGKIADLNRVYTNRSRSGKNSA